MRCWRSWLRRRDQPEHPLLGAARRALPARSGERDRYLALLRRRLTALRALAEPPHALSPLQQAALRPSPLARRVLAPLEQRWDDGDEQLARGRLDGWLRESGPPRVALARRALDAAHEIAAIQARPEALGFFLWELESLLEELAGDQGPADNPESD